MDNEKLNWYTAYTLPNFEKKVYADLQKRKVEAYLPLQNVTRRWSDRMKRLQVPLFPNYIFIRSTDCKGITVLNVKGILNFIFFDGHPALVSDSEIDLIKKLANESIQMEPSLVQGDKVKIVRGPLAGMEGRLFNRKGKSRFGVRIETIKQSLSLEVPTQYLEKV